MEVWVMGRCFTASAIAALFLTQCTPAPSPAPQFRALNQPAAVALLPDQPIPSDPTDAPDSPQLTTPESTTVTFEGVAFDSRSHRLLVVDQHGGPATEFKDAAEAAAAHKGMAAINGGFFTPEGEPLGLVVTNRQAIGQWNAESSLTSGVFSESADGRMSISRRESIGAQKARQMRHLLQAGPMLIDQYQAVGGLDDEKLTSRSFMLWDGKSRWWIGRSSDCSLQQLANTIREHPPVGWSPKQALNLDGGTSTQLWIGPPLSPKPFSSSHWWTKPARNYLVVVAR